MGPEITRSRWSRVGAVAGLSLLVLAPPALAQGAAGERDASPAGLVGLLTSSSTASMTPRPAPSIVGPQAPSGLPVGLTLLGPGVKATPGPVAKTGGTQVLATVGGAGSSVGFAVIKTSGRPPGGGPGGYDSPP
jgi:hypothetical protein